MHFNQVEFGCRLRRARRERGFTQERLAEELNISTDHLGKLELGRRGVSIDLLIDTSSIQTELDEILEQQPIDEERAKSVILKVATEQFEALGDEEYETIRLRRQFTAATEPSAELLKSTVAEVVVDQRQVRLRLKNGQIIERSDLQ